MCDSFSCGHVCFNSFFYVCTPLCTSMFLLYTLFHTILFLVHLCLHKYVCCFVCTYVSHVCPYFSFSLVVSHVYVFLLQHTIWHICLDVYSHVFLKVFAQVCTRVFSRECIRNCSLGFCTRVSRHVFSVYTNSKSVCVCVHVLDILCKCLCKRALFLWTFSARLCVFVSPSSCTCASLCKSVCACAYNFSQLFVQVCFYSWLYVPENICAVCAHLCVFLDKWF
jgi:hypothetical protein